MPVKKVHKAGHAAEAVPTMPELAREHRRANCSSSTKSNPHPWSLSRGSRRARPRADSAADTSGQKPRKQVYKQLAGRQRHGSGRWRRQRGLQGGRCHRHGSWQCAASNRRRPRQASTGLRRQDIMERAGTRTGCALATPAVNGSCK